MKLIPGSAEQRGTDFVRALRGETPFCRCHSLCMLDILFPQCQAAPAL